ncbi:MAG TPA: M12 family metallopeptidase [Casimicrobiaceae bacterium]|nr:M12 family metallopeptidase [Casimicrobiaceae bacterium]
MYLCTRKTCALLLLAFALAATLPVAGATETRQIVVQERETGQLATLDVVHGYAAVGDILVGRMDDVLRDGFAWPQPLSARSASLKAEQYLVQGARSWPLPIAYVIDESFPPANRSAITDALAHFANLSGIRFVRATTESNYLRFLPESDSTECGHSFFGMQGGDQPIYIRCVGAGTVVHEIMHALGFGHEHQRADRDSFIRLHPECVTPETMATFQGQVLQTFQSAPYGPYDYASIMHYPERGAFSSTCPVITPIPTDFFDSSPGLFWGLDAQPYAELTPCFSGIGQTCGLSRGDVVALNYFYGGAPLAGAVNYEGLWWAAPAGSESGWGINLAHQGDVIFATWFTYDVNGKPWWLTMTANETAEGQFSGTLYRSNGPLTGFGPPAPTPTAVGSGTLTFGSATSGTFSYQVSDGANVATQTKTIVLQTFGPAPTCVWGAQPDLTKAANFQDLWWAAPAGSESGWGLNLTQQGTTIFATWFTYDVNQDPLWLSVTAPQTGPNAYTGTLYLTNGPAFGSVAFDPTKVGRTAVGTATFTFSDGNNGTFAYSVDLGDGVNKANRAKAITRQVFRAPGTVCH